ncbi:MAG TPA: DUF1638 domain-containing protein [Streptosporangiaceae bacterium]|nr:DUF1638 domain-containing protein [Streptosporangiaceae bacterium]
MSSSPTAPTSTTVSSASCSSPDDQARPRVAVIACGALAGHIREIAGCRGWPLELHALPSLLHDHPDRIAEAAERLARELTARGLRVVLGYADCGSYGALDELCARLGLTRLPGLHCYDVLAGPGRLRAVFEEQPGTYLLTDFLVRAFRRCVLAELGLDRYPQLWPDYFGHYRRVVWLRQRRDPGLDAEAAVVAAMFGLPLTVLDVGTGRLERELARLLGEDPGRPLWAGSRCSTACRGMACPACSRCCATPATRCSRPRASTRRCWSGCLRR